MVATLKNVAFCLSKAVESTIDSTFGTAHILDSHQSGSLLTWTGEEWHNTDLEGKTYRGTFERAAVVSLDESSEDYPQIEHPEYGPENDPDAADLGLNQVCEACDLDCGEWVIDASKIESLRETYGTSLVVIWEQQA